MRRPLRSPRAATGRLRVVQYGLGPIGRATARALVDHPRFRLVGAIDRDPALAGRDLGDVLRLGRRLGLTVAADAAPVLRRRSADLVFHTTVSRMADAVPQIEQALAAGLDVVSSTETLAYPWLSAPRLAARLHKSALRHRATVHGTGVNPGFAMDVLALVLGHVALDVRHVTARRIVDAALRREALRRKVGAGLSAAEFRRRARQGLGHVGLLESMQMVAAGLGWRLDRFTRTLAPVIARRAFGGAVPVRRGEAAGQREVMRGYRDGREVMRFELTIAMGADGPRDEVVLRGDPPLTLQVVGGTPGDAATVAALLNAAPRVVAAPPGLLTALDLPLPRFGGR
jgi:4-hydroxy-tetrahydrodipicolinate reductase